MKTSRTWGGAAALVAAWMASSSTGCASVLGLDDFTEAEAGATSSTGTGDATTSSSGDPTTTVGPGGGAGGSGGGATSSTSTGGDGGGGAGAGGEGGGGTPPLECVADAPFDVFSGVELGGAQPDDERITAVAAPGSNRVHAAVVTDEGGGSFRILARTMRVGAVPDLNQILTFPANADQQHRRIVGGYTTPGRVHFWGTQGSRAGEFSAVADEDLAGQISFTEYEMPAGCFEVHALQVHQDAAGVARYAATCVTQLDAYLYGGTSGGGLDFQVGPVPLVDFEVPDDMTVRAYARIGGQHVIFTGSDSLSTDGAFVRVGSTAAELMTARPMTPPPEQGLIMVTGPEIDGRLFMAALHADPELVSSGEFEGAMYRTGTIIPADVTALADDVTRVLPHALSFTSASDVAAFFTLKRSGSLVLSAARTLVQSGNDVALGGWTLDGAVAIDRFRVHQAPAGSAILAADVAPAGFGAQAVIWTERVGADSFRVRASGVQCLAPEN